MEYEIPVTELTREQKISSTRLTEMVSREDLGEMASMVKVLEEEGFSLVISNPPQTIYSILMPSRKVLDVSRNKQILDNMSREENPEINDACLYFGVYLSFFSRIHSS